MSTTVPQTILDLIPLMRERVQALLDVSGVRSGGVGGTCVFSTKVVFETLVEYGYASTIYAGSFAWPCVDKDTGGDTHFAYEYQDAPLVNLIAHTHIHGLPEVHCWVEFGDAVIDLTTGELPALAAKNDVDWTGAYPPDFLCGEIPDGVRYLAHPNATAFAAWLCADLDARYQQVVAAERQGEECLNN